MKKILVFLAVSIISMIIISCDSDGKNSIVSKFTTATSSPGVVTSVGGSTSTSTSAVTEVERPNVYGLITDNYGLPVSGVTIQFTSLANANLKYQSQTKSATSEVTIGAAGTKYIYNFAVDSLVSGVYTVIFSKPGYMNKEFLLQAENEDIHFTAEIYNNLSTNLGAISAHYNPTANLPSSGIAEIILIRYLTQDDVEMSSSPPLQIINPPSDFVDGHFKFENLPETVEYTKRIMHPDGSIEEFQMKTLYRIKLSVLNTATATYQNILGDQITVKAKETTLVEIYNTSGSSAATVPNLISPPNTSELAGETPTFSWEPVSGAVAYEILVKEDSDDDGVHDVSTDQVVWQFIVKGATSVIYSQLDQLYPMTVTNLGIYNGNTSSLASGTRYFWMVRAINGVTELPFTDPPFSFIKRSESAPVVLSPLDGSYVSSQYPTFGWTCVPDTKQYVVELSATDEVGGNGILAVVWSKVVSNVDYDPHKDNSYYTTYNGDLPLTRGTTYYWRVAAADNNNTPTAWSQQYSFTILPAPPAPESANFVWVANAKSATVNFGFLTYNAASLKTLKLAGFVLNYYAGGAAYGEPYPLHQYWNGTATNFAVTVPTPDTSEVYSMQISSYSSSGAESGYISVVLTQ
ncbi:MAG: carboxypeptidase-like regulatory domain-containing protein [Candidatus Wallbacteria bacterium]|nr:carboxypeptidase-like regulatory domain-containing protein [Candidatus Wallbacteria bacterium]